VAPDTRILVQFDYLNDLRLDDLGIPALAGPPGSGFPGLAPAVPIGSYYGAPNSFDNDYVRSAVDTATITTADFGR
jgi:catecholate siderophore receptor